MDTPKIFDSELRFCEILWQHEPVKSSELVRLCADELGWKKSTTYTVIKRLTERGVVHTENAVVTALVGRQDVQNAESRAFVDKNFHGSLPAFLSAFIGNKQLTQQEADELLADDRQVRGGAPWISCSTRYWSFRGRPG